MSSPVGESNISKKDFLSIIDVDDDLFSMYSSNFIAFTNQRILNLISVFSSSVADADEGRVIPRKGFRWRARKLLLD